MEALLALVTEGITPRTVLRMPSFPQRASVGMRLASRYSGPKPSHISTTTRGGPERASHAGAPRNARRESCGSETSAIQPQRPALLTQPAKARLRDARPGHVQRLELLERQQARHRPVIDIARQPQPQFAQLGQRGQDRERVVGYRGIA